MAQADQKSKKDLGAKASPAAPKQTKPAPRPGKANPAEDYKSHPKFAKFEKGA